MVGIPIYIQYGPLWTEYDYEPLARLFYCRVREVGGWEPSGGGVDAGSRRLGGREDGGGENWT